MQGTCMPVPAHTHVPPSPPLPCWKPPAASRVTSDLTRVGWNAGDVSTDQDPSILGYGRSAHSSPEPASRSARYPPGRAAVMTRTDL